MSLYKDFKLIKEDDGYTLVLTIDQNSTEFSKELLGNIKENILQLDDEIRRIVKEKYPNIKINTVKLMLGGLMVGSMPFATNVTAHAATISSTSTTTTATNQTFSSPATGTVTASQLNVRQGPGTSYAIIHTLWQGNVVKVLGQSGDWYNIQLSDGRTGWVSSAYLQVNLTQQKINIVVSTAKSLLGTPYVWGGASPQDGGFDCSGLTQYVYKQAGYTLNRISSDQAKQGTAVSVQNLRPGDLVFYSIDQSGTVNHVGIYIGNGQMIHSPKTGDVVKTTDMTTSYWQTRIITIRRIIQ